VQHTKAIRSLDYNPNLGVGYILSVGFEYYINVWSPEVALNDAHKGKLEGHYSPVITCKFLSGSPMCVSVDEEGNIRVWDIRYLLCLQLIPQEKKNFKVCFCF
jgi:WD40 repeat protein